MFRRLLFAFAVTGAMLLPAAAEAAGAQVMANVNLRAGPGTTYYKIMLLPRGTPVQVNGCLQGYSWCDVSYGRERGWVSANYLSIFYVNQVYRPARPVVVVPSMGFDFGYWDRYYRGRPWYTHRAPPGGWRVGTPPPPPVLQPMAPVAPRAGWRPGPAPSPMQPMAPRGAWQPGPAPSPAQPMAPRGIWQPGPAPSPAQPMWRQHDRHDNPPQQFANPPSAPVAGMPRQGGPAPQPNDAGPHKRLPPQGGAAPGTPPTCVPGTPGCAP